jgi:hypothetical protein
LKTPRHQEQSDPRAGGANFTAPMSCNMTDEREQHLILRRVDHPQARDNNRVIWIPPPLDQPHQAENRGRLDCFGARFHITLYQSIFGRTTLALPVQPVLR